MRRLVTRKILEEVRAHIPGTEAQVLRKMEQLVGGPVELIEDFEDGEPGQVLLCMRAHVQVRDVEDTCDFCGHQVFHRPDKPPEMRVMCYPCYQERERGN